MVHRVAYVVKRYPRFSETFIVNEILAHEAAGLSIELYSLRPPVDTHFQDLISRVRAPLTYLSDGQVKATDLWLAMRKAQRLFAMRSQALTEILATENVLDAFCGIQLAQHCLTNKVEHIHAHFASSAASVARIASMLSGIPYSMTAHAKDIFHESVQADDLARKLHSASSTFTVSQFNLNYLRERFPDVCQNVIKLYNGMHLDDFAYRSPAERSNRIVAVGRFVEKKGFQDLILACRELKERQVDFSCFLIGGGELEDRLRSMVEELNLQEQVKLLGPQPQRNVKELIQSSAVMAAPCVHGEDGNRDGLPTVLLESMALGTPCVSTAVTGIPEVVQHGHSGLIVPENAPTELANALSLLLSKAELRVRFAEAARQLIETDFDIVHNAARQRSLFHRHATVENTSDELVTV